MTTLEPVEVQINLALPQVPVLHSDETGVRQAGARRGCMVGV